MGECQRSDNGATNTGADVGTTSPKELPCALGSGRKCSVRTSSGSRPKGGKTWEENLSTLVLSLKSEYSNDHSLEAGTMFNSFSHVPGTFPRLLPLVEPQQA